MEPKSKTVYFATANVEPEWEDEFNRWYDEEHIPGLLKVPGYLSGKRYIAVDSDPKYLAFWQIESMDAYRSEAHDIAAKTEWTAKVAPHMQINLWFCEQVYPESGIAKGVDWGADLEKAAIMVNRFEIDPAGEENYNAWYHEEHIPALCGVPGVIAARRFKEIGRSNYTAMYYLTAPEVQASDAWRKAADSPRGDEARKALLTRWRAVYRPLK